ncbi:hypothetical protein AB1471_08935 [Jeotgalibacillus marinus]|uniref:Uncharacterized protein n=2 Tax=Jeotgalibacillus marinus TaxID=86667 RepID=A0ABV3Q3S2_9BACL
MKVKTVYKIIGGFVVFVGFGFGTFVYLDHHFNKESVPSAEDIASNNNRSNTATYMSHEDE